MAKIMLVEDDNNLREIYEARLQAEGYTLISAKDGEEALVLAKNEKPDLVISDVMMPKISGFEMLDILRNTEGLKEVKVIMLTALGQSDDQQRADRLGADRYLVKSQVTLEDIVKVAHDLLEDIPAAAAVEATPAVPAEPTVAPVSAVEPDMPPVAAAEPAETPQSIASIPEPVTAVAATDSVAQSTAQEEATVEARIEDFVQGASSEAPPAVPDTTSPSAAVPQPADATAASDEASDDKVMAQAVSDLAAGTQPQATDPAAPISVAPLQNPVSSAPVASATPTVEAAPEPTANGSVPIAHKKIITPIDSEPKQDINALLAIEEAKEAGTTTVAPPPEANPAAALPEPAAGTPPPSAAPSAEVSVPAPNNPLDPNSIAL